MHLIKTGALASVVLLTLVACDDTSGSSSSFGDSDTKIQKAFDSCNKAADTSLDSTIFEVADGGDSLIIDGASETTDIANLGCLLGSLNTSQAVVSEMDSTTAMMGRQEEEDDDFTYAWSYHPDNGFQMTVREK